MSGSLRTLAERLQSGEEPHQSGPFRAVIPDLAPIADASRLGRDTPRTASVRGCQCSNRTERGTIFGPRRFVRMRRLSYYHAQADHARRLADKTPQQNLERELRRVAEEFDHLAEDIATAEADFRDPEILTERTR